MPKPREIKRHIQSIQGINKVTRAMDVVSAAKAHRLSDGVRNSRPFAERSLEVLQHVATSGDLSVADNPVFRGHVESDTTALVLITSNRGMVGAYNYNVVSQAMRYLERRDAPPEVITIGKVGRNALRRRGIAVQADYSALDDHSELEDLQPLSRLLWDGFDSRHYGSVVLAHTLYHLGARMVPTVTQLLPIAPDPDLKPRSYIFEPDAASLLRELLPRILTFQIYQALFESFMAENTARVIAMRQATKNAGDLINDLTIRYNKARQQSITSDLMDIMGGSAALE